MNNAAAAPRVSGPSSPLYNHFTEYRYAGAEPKTQEKVGHSDMPQPNERQVTDLAQEGSPENVRIIGQFKQQMKTQYGLPENFLTLILGDVKAQRLEKGEFVETKAIDELVREMDKWVSLKERVVVGLNPGKEAFQYISQEVWKETIQTAFNGDVVNRERQVKTDDSSSVLEQLKRMGYRPEIFSQELRAKLVSSDTKKQDWTNIEKELKASIQDAIMVNCVKKHNIMGFADVHVESKLPSHATGGMFAWGAANPEKIQSEATELEEAILRSGMHLGLFTQDVQDAVKKSQDVGEKISLECQRQISEQIKAFQKRSLHLAMLMDGEHALQHIEVSKFYKPEGKGLDISAFVTELRRCGYAKPSGAGKVLSFDDCRRGRVTFYTQHGIYTTKLSAFDNQLDGIEALQSAIDSCHLMSVYLHGTATTGSSVAPESDVLTDAPLPPRAPTPPPVEIPQPSKALVAPVQAPQAPTVNVASGVSSKPVMPQGLLQELTGKNHGTRLRPTGLVFDPKTGDFKGASAPKVPSELSEGEKLVGAFTQAIDSRRQQIEPEEENNE